MTTEAPPTIGAANLAPPPLPDREAGSAKVRRAQSPAARPRPLPTEGAPVCKPLLIALAAFVFSSSTWAQSLADICATVELPTMAEYEGNAGAYADNFCALATYAPQRAASQLNKTISLVRATNNPNRFYWDPKIEPTAEYIQLLRPWMVDQGGWQIRRLRYGLFDNDNRHVLYALFVSPDGQNFGLELGGPSSLLGTLDAHGDPRSAIVVSIVGITPTPSETNTRYTMFYWFVAADQSGTYLMPPGRIERDTITAGNQVTALVHNALDCLGESHPEGGSWYEWFLSTQGEAGYDCPMPLP